MSFAMLVVGNLLRQKIRTGLTVIGISIGITAVVALGIITDSLKASTEQFLTAGDSDFFVSRSGTSDLTFSTLNHSDLETVASYGEIEHVTGVLQAYSRVGANPYFLQFGVDAKDLDAFNVPLVKGRRLAPGATDEVMLGKDAAGNLHADVGGTVTIHDRTFTVVGIYNSGQSVIDGGALLPLETVQAYESKPDSYSVLYVKVRPGTDKRALGDRIEREHPELAAVVDLGDYGDVDQGLKILDAVNLGITILAVFIGGIAVMNTMAMAVFERTREFGILRAVGWRTRRIIQMVLGESIVLCLISSVVGSLVAIGVTRLIVLLPAIEAFISPAYPVEVFLRGLAVGIGVALLGALYPAFRAASYSPAQAIRYE